MSVFEGDKTLGYGLMGLMSQCFPLKKQHWKNLFAQAKIPFDQQLYDQLATSEIIEKIELELSKVGTASVSSAVTASTPEEKKEPQVVHKEEPQVDFSSFF